MTRPPAPEFSRPVRIGEIGKGGLAFPVEANGEEKNALATLLGVVRVGSLTAEVEVSGWRKGGAHLKADYRINLTRTCVVTLEDFDETIEDRVDVYYAHPSDKILVPGDDGELILDPDSDDVPEILEGAGFDAGDAIAQHIALNLDPYPRKPGAEFGVHEEGEAEASPFAVLKALKADKDQ